MRGVTDYRRTLEAARLETTERLRQAHADYLGKLKGRGEDDPSAAELVFAVGALSQVLYERAMVALGECLRYAEDGCSSLTSDDWPYVLFAVEPFFDGIDMADALGEQASAFGYEGSDLP